MAPGHVPNHTDKRFCHRIDLKERGKRCDLSTLSRKKQLTGAKQTKLGVLAHAYMPGTRETEGEFKVSLCYLARQ